LACRDDDDDDIETTGVVEKRFLGKKKSQSVQFGKREKKKELTMKTKLPQCNCRDVSLEDDDIFDKINSYSYKVVKVTNKKVEVNDDNDDDDNDDALRRRRRRKAAMIKNSSQQLFSSSSPSAKQKFFFWRWWKTKRRIRDLMRKRLLLVESLLFLQVSHIDWM